MTLQISGKLITPTGAPAANAMIRFNAIGNTQNVAGEVIHGASSTEKCAADGTYSIELQYCTYEIATKISTPNWIVHGRITVTKDTLATDLEDLLYQIGFIEDLGSGLIKEFLNLSKQSQDAANAAKASETNAAASANSASETLHNVTIEGGKQVQAITDEGTSQLQAVTMKGNEQVQKVASVGSGQVSSVNSAGATQVNRVQEEGTKQYERAKNEADSASASASSATSSQNAAKASADKASTSEGNAKASEDAAKQYASNADVSSSIFTSLAAELIKTQTIVATFHPVY